MGRVVLACVERPFAVRVQALADASPQLDISELNAGEEIFSEIERSAASIDALILGPDLADPVQLAQRIHVLDKDLSIVIVSAADHYQGRRLELQCAPFLGPQVRCLDGGTKSSPSKLVSDAAAMTRQRRAFRTTTRTVRVSADAADLWRQRPALYLDHLLEHAPLGVVLLDRHMALVALNREARVMLEADQGNAIGARLASYFEEEERSRLDQFLQRTAATMGRKPPDVFRRRQADGSERHIDVVASTLSRDNGDARLMVILDDCTDRVHSEEQRRLLMRELDHRVKNSLAAVLALARRTLHGSKDADEFMEAFQGRILAMARVHEALAAAKWQGAELEDIVGLVVQAHAAPDHQHIRFCGDHVSLSAVVAQPICMALHELMTNAVKYGSMSVPEGRLDVRWQLLQDGALVIEWRESDGPATSDPGQLGLGISLLRGLVEHELSGEVSLDFEPGGVVCRVRVPLDG